MTSPRVSVIVPAYNAVAYLDSALASVAAQTRPADQIVVVDDGSTDDTAALAHPWASRLPLKVLELPVNVGLGTGRHTAIEASDGELIALLDSDDVWFPDHLDAMVAQYERRPGLVTAGNYRWWPGRRAGQRASYDTNPIPPPDRQRVGIIEQNFVFIGSLFHRDDYDRAGGFADRRYLEDWDLWFRMIFDAGVVVTSPGTVTALYRQRLDSISSLDNLLDHDLEFLDVVGRRTDLDRSERAAVAAARRRRIARRELLDGYDLARDGHVGKARRTWLRAARRDPRLRLGLGETGSTSLRAFVCIAAPTRAVRYRDSRLDRSV